MIKYTVDRRYTANGLLASTIDVFPNIKAAETILKQHATDPMIGKSFEHASKFNLPFYVEIGIIKTNE